MALTLKITRRFFLPKPKPLYFPHFSRFFFHTSEIPKTPPLTRPFCTKKPNPKLVNFSLPSDTESDSETIPTKKVDTPKLPPPYDPFNKKPAIEEPEDPKNLQEVFAKIREDGLMNSAVKMFDGLSQDGLTHEALQLFSQIKDKGQMPDVVAHTAVVEAYVNAKQAKDAHKVYLRMLSSGVLPNAYTYRVVIKGLAQSGDVKMVKEANKYVGEMVGRGMKPNAGICVDVFEGLVSAGLEDEGREMLEMLKEKGVVPEENKVTEILKKKRGVLVHPTFMSVLYGK
ncbi:hypothetical protein ACJIZ3_001009 [Penstemon smallii]|uniref:Pentatricopeptide repeat-containing protein n=1 Tax=Penstemon smallii TaxID=265156 RepID=A0ABD3U2D7_9LAMI